MDTTTLPSSGNRLDILFRDDSIIVANKPAGLLSVPGRGVDKVDSLATRLQNEFPDSLSVHRLDMGTSGLIVLARGKEMQRRLSGIFRERRIEKHYVAIVSGQMNAALGEIELPLGADWPNRPRQKLDFTSGKRSLTRYCLLAHDASTNTSRLELEPLTGRTHQLRLHLAAIGRPILGDRLYGGDAAMKAGRLLLHASVLKFAHPLSGARLRFECAPPF